MIDVSGLSARSGEFALQDVAFAIPAGGYGVVIGPAGAGKTTLLETLAGIRRAEAGRVMLGGTDMTSRPPEERGIGFVYQHAFLFPHLSVWDNIRYGAASENEAKDVAERFGAASLGERPVRSLSGGERQLVAIARALASRPSTLLLDEPFNALDPRRRASVRRQLRAFQRERSLTTLQVTHDFTEAGLLGDVAILLDSGRVLQSGPPATVFRKPATPYVAEFLGAENVFAGTVVAPRAPDASATAHGIRADGIAERMVEFRTENIAFSALSSAPEGPAYAVIRAEEIVVATEPLSGSARNQLQGKVAEVAELGALTRVVIDVRGVPLIASLTTQSATEMGIREGADVFATFKAMAVHLC